MTREKKNVEKTGTRNDTGGTKRPHVVGRSGKKEKEKKEKNYLNAGSAWGTRVPREQRKKANQGK